MNKDLQTVKADKSKESQLWEDKMKFLEIQLEQEKLNKKELDKEFQGEISS